MSDRKHDVCSAAVGSISQTILLVDRSDVLLFQVAFAELSFLDEARAGPQ